MHSRLVWLALAIISLVVLVAWYNTSPENICNCNYQWQRQDSDKSPKKTFSGLSKKVDIASIEKKPKPSDLHDKWVVVTTINQPTKDVEYLSKMKGWKVVVVGDTKTPKNWR